MLSLLQFNKKILSLCLALVMLFSINSSDVFAKSETSSSKKQVVSTITKEGKPVIISNSSVTSLNKVARIKSAKRIKLLSKLLFIVITPQKSSYVNPLKTDVNQLLTLLDTNNAGDYSIEGNGIGYYYKNLLIGLWRESTPEDIYGMIEESKADNTYHEMKEDLEQDLEKSKYFTTIGIGIENYYQDIDDLICPVSPHQ